MNKLVKFGGLKDELYLGQKKLGVREGMGIQLFLSYSAYIGQWQNNKASGIGKAIFADGTTFTGNFKNNYFQFGTINYSTGATFVGRLDGSAEENLSEGTFTFANEIILEGKWVKGGSFLSGRLINPKKRPEEIVNVSFEALNDSLQNKRFMLNESCFIYNGLEGVCIDNNKKTLSEGNIASFELNGPFNVYYNARKICSFNYEKNTQKGFNNEVNLERGYVKNYEIKEGTTHCISDMFLFNGMFVKFNEERYFSEVTLPALGEDYFVRNGSGLTINLKSWETRFTLGAGTYYYFKNEEWKTLKLDNFRNPVECSGLFPLRIGFNSLFQKYTNIADNIKIEPENITGVRFAKIYEVLSQWTSEIVKCAKEGNFETENFTHLKLLEEKTGKLEIKEETIIQNLKDDKNPFESQISPIHQPEIFKNEKVEDNLQLDYRLNSNQETHKGLEDTYPKRWSSQLKNSQRVEKRSSARIKSKEKEMIHSFQRASSSKSRPSKSKSKRKMLNESISKTVQKIEEVVTHVIEQPIIPVLKCRNLKTREKITMCARVINNIIDKKINYHDIEKDILLAKQFEKTVLQNFKRNPVFENDVCFKIDRPIFEPEIIITNYEKQTKNYNLGYYNRGDLYHTPHCYSKNKNQENHIEQEMNQMRVSADEFSGSEFSNQKRNDILLLITKDADRELNGFCTVIYLNGSVFKGQFIDGVKKGPGLVLTVENKVYIGEYLDDQPINKFMVIENDKLKHEEVFRNGKFRKIPKGTFQQFKFPELSEPGSDFSELATFSNSTFRIACPFSNNLPKTDTDWEIINKLDNWVHKGTFFLDENLNAGTFRDKNDALFITNFKRRKICKITV